MQRVFKNAVENVENIFSYASTFFLLTLLNRFSIRLEWRLELFLALTW